MVMETAMLVSMPLVSVMILCDHSGITEDLFIRLHDVFSDWFDSRLIFQAATRTQDQGGTLDGCADVDPGEDPHPGQVGVWVGPLIETWMSELIRTRLESGLISQDVGAGGDPTRVLLVSELLP